MSKPKPVFITESLSELRKLQKQNIPMIADRTRVLIEFKINQDARISKRNVALKVGADPNSVQNWRTMYLKGGVGLILSHERKGGRPSNITAQEHLMIAEKLLDIHKPLRGYVELVDWVATELDKKLTYNALYKYSRRHFGSKIKVTRKKRPSIGRCS